MGDRTRLFSGIIERVYQDLSGSEYDLIILNSSDSSGTFRHVNATGTVKYKTAVSALVALGWQSSYLGSSITPRKAWADIPERYYGTNFVHVGVIFDYLATVEQRRGQVNVEFISNPCVYPSTKKAAASEHGGYDESVLNIFLNDWSRVVNLLPGDYSVSAKRTTIKSRRFSVVYLVFLRRRRLYGIHSYRKYKPLLKSSTDVSLLFALVISLFPVPVLEMIKKAKDAVISFLPSVVVDYLKRQSP